MTSRPTQKKALEGIELHHNYIGKSFNKKKVPLVSIYSAAAKPVAVKSATDTIAPAQEVATKEDLYYQFSAGEKIDVIKFTYQVICCFV